MNYTEAEALGRCWERMSAFCDERGWSAELYVREDVGANFGRIGCRINQAGCSFTTWAGTTAKAIRRAADELAKDGFHE